MNMPRSFLKGINDWLLDGQRYPVCCKGWWYVVNAVTLYIESAVAPPPKREFIIIVVVARIIFALRMDAFAATDR